MSEYFVTGNQVASGPDSSAGIYPIQDISKQILAQLVARDVSGRHRGDNLTQHSPRRSGFAGVGPARKQLATLNV